MVIFDQAEAVSQFLQLTKPLVTPPLLAGKDLIMQMVDFYQNVRIKDADLALDGDMLLLEWGEQSPNILNGPTDLCSMDDRQINFAAQSYQWLGITRQVCATTDTDAEFDDVAIALCLFLFFSESNSRLRSANIWVQTPAQLSEKIEKFFNVPYVASLINTYPAVVTAFVSGVG